MKSSNSSYLFGPFRLDKSERVLLRDNQPVQLAPKAFETLLVLIQRNGQVVGKDDLMEQVWPDTCVEEANLTQNIFTLRKILAEGSEGSKYIETIPRRGYRFVALVKEVPETKFVSPATDQVNDQVPDTQLGRALRFLAVLPFVNASADSNMEYLSDGITESIINSLSQLPRLRVMSRSTVFRYKGRKLDAQRIGRELGVDAVLAGRVHSRQGRLVVSAELVDVDNGWQLWGANYDRGSQAIFEVQDEIAKQISAALRLKLTGEEEQKLTRRYTENTDAYQAYLKGRHYWSKYTREGLEEGIRHFQQAIGLDPNYALAYAGLVDCYLRLATNYIPPENDLSKPAVMKLGTEIDAPTKDATSMGSAKVRYEWDRKAAEREIKRATELKTNYPALHQWYTAYLFSVALYDKILREMKRPRERNDVAGGIDLWRQLQWATLTPAEEVQIFCTIARNQIDTGNFDAARVLLERWWTIGQWPALGGLNPQSSADLLFTTGTLAGWLASTRQMPKGQKHAEELLNGAVAIFEQLGLKTRSSEGRVELAYCYYREGLFDLARSTLLAAVIEVSEEERELRCLGLIRFATLERHAGRLHDAFDRLKEASKMVELSGPPATGRYHLELATTLKNLAISERHNEYFDQAIYHYAEAFHEFEAIGDHRHAAIVENNHGYLLLTLKRFDDAEVHLTRARKLFDGFADQVRRAQVDETLAQLHVAAERFDVAEQAIVRAVESLEAGGEDALLAEALRTHGVVLCRLTRQREAKRVLDRANRVAESCGDSEGAGRALLIMIEEMCEGLDDEERVELGNRLEQLLANSQQDVILKRLRRCRELIAESHARYRAGREQEI